MLLLKNARITLEMIKWEHSVFALPFALCGAMLAARGIPTLHQLLWIIAAMIAVIRSSMTLARLVVIETGKALPSSGQRHNLLTNIL